MLLPLFNEALYSSDTLIISDACRAFGRLLDAAPESSYKCILKPNTIECLVEHMGNPNSKISLAALLAVGNIVSGDDEQTQSNFESIMVPVYFGFELIFIGKKICGCFVLKT